MLSLYELCIRSILLSIINIDDDDNTEEWFQENTEELALDIIEENVNAIMP